MQMEGAVKGWLTSARKLRSNRIVKAPTQTEHRAIRPTRDGKVFVLGWEAYVGNTNMHIPGGGPNGISYHIFEDIPFSVRGYSIYRLNRNKILYFRQQTRSW